MAARQGGFSLIEIMIALVIIGLAASIAVPMYADAIHEARANALQQDGKTLHSALMRYYNDNSAFPSDDDLDIESLDPLNSEGYLDGSSITDKLVGGQLLVYLAPDVGGDDQQFIAVLRHAEDPTVLVGVVHTNIVTDDGDWVDGSYVIDAQDLEESGVEDGAGAKDGGGGGGDVEATPESPAG
jgi:prepilin-type N-terminal cleavage/methylation domain-containing protein